MTIESSDKHERFWTPTGKVLNANRRGQHRAYGWWHHNRKASLWHELCSNMGLYGLFQRQSCCRGRNHFIGQNSGGGTNAYIWRTRVDFPLLYKMKPMTHTHTRCVWTPPGVCSVMNVHPVLQPDNRGRSKWLHFSFVYQTKWRTDVRVLLLLD